MALNRTISTLLKILIISGSAIYLLIRILKFGNWPEAWDQMRLALEGDPLWLLVAAMLLLPVNYGIEVIKWRLAVKPAETISAGKSLTGILTGLSMSVLTPNRIGDIVTRNFVLKPGNRLAGSALTSINSLAQTIVTILFGIPATFIYLMNRSGNLPEKLNSGLIIYTSAATLLLSVALFLWLHIPVAWLSQKKRFQWLEKASHHLQLMPLTLKIMLLLLSALKYGVYLLQFALLLQFAGLHLPIQEVLIAVSVIYLILNMIPVPSLGDFGARGSVALLILEPLSAGMPAILTASMGIWFINILVPAAAGLVLMSRVKF